LIVQNGKTDVGPAKADEPVRSSELAETGVRSRSEETMPAGRCL